MPCAIHADLVDRTSSSSDVVVVVASSERGIMRFSMTCDDRRSGPWYPMSAAPSLPWAQMKVIGAPSGRGVCPQISNDVVKSMTVLPPTKSMLAPSTIPSPTIPFIRLRSFPPRR